MKHFKALRSRFQKVSPQVNFEELTRSLIVFNTDIGQLHKDMVLHVMVAEENMLVWTLMLNLMIHSTAV